MSKKVTLKDIADEAGVSKATVSMILNRRGINNFNPKTVALVYKLAADLNYVSVNGKHFTYDRVDNRLIKIIVPSFFNPLYSNMVKGIEDAALKAGYQTIISTTYWDADREIALLDKAQLKQVDGVIFCMIPQNVDYVHDISHRLPIVVVGDKRAELQLSTVDINNYFCGRRLAHYLYRLGHKDITFIADSLSEQDNTTLNRCKGMKSYCEEHGMRFYIYGYADAEIGLREDSKHNFSVGRETTRKLLREFPNTTAVVAVNDLVAMGVYKTLQELGLSVPKDMSVCCFDNMTPHTFNGDKLTCVDSDAADCGKTAFDLLMSQIGEIEDNRTINGVTHIEFPCNVVEGESTAVPRKEFLPDLDLLGNYPKDLPENTLQPRIVRRCTHQKREA